MQGEDGLASRCLAYGRKKPVKNGPDAADDQARAEDARKTKMLEIAFMDMVQMFLAFV